MGEWVLKQSGLRSALGPGAKWALPAARAGISHPVEIDFAVIDEEDEAQKLVGYPAFGPFEGFYQFGLWSHLGSEAILDLVKQLPGEINLSTGTFLLVSAPRPSMERTLWDLEEENPFEEFLCRPMLDLCNLKIPTASRQTSGCGAEGGWLGLSALNNLPQAVQYCLQIGMDSLTDSESLEWLASQNRLKSPEQPNGVMPGQAAACLLWERNKPHTTSPGFTLLSVHTLPGESLAEAATSEAGRRLAKCIQTVIQQAKTNKIHPLFSGLIVTDRNGENKKAEAWAYAQMFSQGNVDWDRCPMIDYCESFGETGAASVPLAMAMAEHHMASGDSPGPYCLVAGLDENGLAGAAICSYHPVSTNSSNQSGFITTKTLEEAPGPYEGAGGFCIGLWHEHLEEISGLLDQRNQMLTDPEVNWSDIHDEEDRIQKHFDALFQGGPVCREVVRQKAIEEEEPGEVFTAVVYLLRDNCLDELKELLDELDWEDEDLAPALANAFEWALEEKHLNPLAKFELDEDTWLEPLAKGMIKRRLPGNHKLAEFIYETVPNQLAWDWYGQSFGIIPPDGQSEKSDLPSPDSDDTDDTNENEKWIRGGLRATGSDHARKAMEFCRQNAAANSIFEPWLALSSGPSVGREILSRLSQAPDASRLLAAGLTGMPDAVPILLQWLQSEKGQEDIVARKAAVSGLYLITGAAIFEEVEETEEVDQDEMFDDELSEVEDDEEIDLDEQEEDEEEESGDQESLQPENQKELPREVSAEYIQLSLDENRWIEWWNNESKKFRQGICFRLGEPMHPRTVVNGLYHPQMPRNIRYWLGEETQIRFGFDAGFVEDTLVKRQQQCLLTLRQWGEGQSSRFIPGKAYFQGKMAG